MPLGSVDVIKEVLISVQKEEIIRKVTDDVIEI